MNHKECGWYFKVKVQRRVKGKSTVTSLCGSESFVVGVRAWDRSLSDKDFR